MLNGTSKLYSKIVLLFFILFTHSYSPEETPFNMFSYLFIFTSVCGNSISTLLFY